MITNLSHPDNKKANQLAQWQRVASVWANDLSRGAISKNKVALLLNEYPPESQVVLKQWLNTYRDAIRNKPKTNSKRRVIPHWIKR